jgi:hypothetical protein
MSTSNSTSNSNKVNKLRAEVLNNAIDKPSSLKNRFGKVSQNSQFEASESGMSEAEKGAAYKEWGRQLAEKSALKAQNAVTKGGTRRKRKRNSKKRKSTRKTKRKSIRQRH